MTSKILTALLVLLCLLSTSLNLRAQEDRIGIFAASSYSSLERTTSFPFTPLSDNQIQNWEFGLYFPILANKYYFSSARLSYLNYGFSETFQLDQGIVETTLSFTGAKLSFEPIGIKIDIGQAGLLLSVGGFGIYQFSEELSESTIEFTFDEDIFEPFVLGGQASAGIKFKNFIVSFTAYNSFSNIIRPSNIGGALTLETPDIPSKLRGGSVALIITLPRKKSQTSKNKR